MAERPNILVIITDQQRASQHFDNASKAAGEETWENLHLPSLTKLKNMGVSFDNAIIGASMCSPSRAAFMTSSYSFQNKIPYVGGNLATENDPNVPNLCRLAVDQGYAVSWKGKWHLGCNPEKDNDGSNVTKPGSTCLDGFISPQRKRNSVTASLEWNPPDSGTSLSIPSTMGGGNAGNDRRFLLDKGTGQIENWTTMGADGTFGMLQNLDNYWNTYAPNDKLRDDAPPFCLFASFVNPHDCAFFDNKETLGTLGYPSCYIKGNSVNPTEPFDIPLPPNFCPRENEWKNEVEEYPLNRKPTCQRECCQGDAVELDTKTGKPTHKKVAAAGNADNTPNGTGIMTDAQRFVNFYAYLTTVVDKEIGELLNWFGEPVGDNPKYALFENTVTIRFADHGEQATSHGLREKSLNAYEETIRVPLVVSNPTFCPSVVTDTVSLVDLVPTIAELMGVQLQSNGQLPHSEWDSNYPISGKSLCQYLPIMGQNNPLQTPALHPHGVVFCYDDIFVSKTAPSMVRALRTDDWTYAIYYDSRTVNGQTDGIVEYELYNRTDTVWSSQFSNTNPLLEASVLETNNLAMVPPEKLSESEQVAVFAQWKTMHYTLLGLMADPAVHVGTPTTIPSLVIRVEDMVKALPYNMDPTATAWSKFCELVTPDFRNYDGWWIVGHTIP